MKHVCINCKVEYEGRLNKIYCSNKCRERVRFLRRKNTSNYIKQQKKRYKKYYYNGGKEQKNEYHKCKKFRDYQNKWRKDNKYHLILYDNNPEINREKARRHRKTLKGKITTLKSNEKRRKKIILLTGKSSEKLNEVLLINIKERDKKCVYCGKQFNNNIKSDTETFDHFDCDKPLSEDNTVICCWSCNSSKRNVPINEIENWIKRKRYIPSPIVMELLKKNK